MKLSSKFMSLFGRHRHGAMTCDQVGEVLQHYLDGHLDERRSAGLAAHLDECRRCGLEAETYERIKLSLAGRRTPVPAESLARLRDFGVQLARGDDPAGSP